MPDRHDRLAANGTCCHLMADEPDIELIRRLQAVEQRIVDLRSVIESQRRQLDAAFPSPLFARFYFTADELRGIADFLDLILQDEAPDWVLLNSFRTAFREGQYQIERHT